MKRALFLLGVVVLTGALWFALLDAPLPESKRGAEADALARSMMRATGASGWDRTGAITWRTEGRRHVWDRRRNVARVQWAGHDVKVNLETLTGEALSGGDPVMDPAEVDLLISKAYAFWAQDHFFLYPFDSLFDAGTTRGKTASGGLLISYPQAPSSRPEGYEGPIKWWGDPRGWKRGVPQEPLRLGLTPGDSYVWSLGADGLPERCLMWAAILPLGGAEVSWSGWQTLSTGAKVATIHKGFRVDRHITELRAAADLESLER